MGLGAVGPLPPSPLGWGWGLLALFPRRLLGGVGGCWPSSPVASWVGLGAVGPLPPSPLGWGWGLLALFRRCFLGGVGGCWPSSPVASWVGLGAVGSQQRRQEEVPVDDRLTSAVTEGLERFLKGSSTAASVSVSWKHDFARAMFESTQVLFSLRRQVGPDDSGDCLVILLLVANSFWQIMCGSHGWATDIAPLQPMLLRANVAVSIRTQVVFVRGSDWVRKAREAQVALATALELLDCSVASAHALPILKSVFDAWRVTANETQLLLLGLLSEPMPSAR